MDMVYALTEAQRRDLVERIESRSGLRQLEYMKLQGEVTDQCESDHRVRVFGISADARESAGKRRAVPKNSQGRRAT
ncbi:MAG: hypothetical protein V8Q91_16940 [Bilophila wadsworthia]|uniref:hypothetical protein n=1 Tax=Bilophila wadsworthia TaxID=35833 RepID=UPI00300F0924